MIRISRSGQSHRVRCAAIMRMAVAAIVAMTFVPELSAQTDLMHTQSSIFPRAALDSFIEAHLDREIADDVRARYEAYAQSHADAWQQRWAKVANAPRHIDRRDQAQSIIQRRRVTSDWNAARRSLFKTFVDDVRGMLDSDRAIEAWDREVRRAQRNDWLRELDPYGGRWARYDPFIYLEDVDVPEVLEDPIANMREVYELDMASAIRRLEADYDRLADTTLKLRMEAEIAAVNAGAIPADRSQASPSGVTSEFLGPAYQQAIEQREALVKRLADVNIRARGDIIEILPEPQRIQYETAWLCTVAPRMCVQSPVEIILVDLEDDDSIDAALQRSLDIVRADYQRERNRLRGELIDAFSEWPTPEMEAQRAEEAARLLEAGADPTRVAMLYPDNAMFRRMFDSEVDFTTRIERTLADAGRPVSSLHARLRVFLSWHKASQ